MLSMLSVLSSAMHVYACECRYISADDGGPMPKAVYFGTIQEKNHLIQRKVRR